MRLICPLMLTALALAGCKSASTVDIVSKPVAQVQTRPRSEPIFYNGKTYKLDFSYRAASSSFAMRVSGMNSKQQGDAVQLATSSLRYYACPDRQTGRMIGAPSYAGGVWMLEARCV